MTKNAKYKTRDPKVTNRDPELTETSQANRMPLPTVIVKPSQCPHCHSAHPVWELGGTSCPNPETFEMLRWRRCRDCGKTHWQRSPMTPEQRKKYALPS